MYCGEESINNNSILDKETLQLSPHIAAHKSSSSVITIPFISDTCSTDSLLQSRLISIPSNAIYKLNVSGNHHVELPYTIRNPNMFVHSSHTSPEDLSATQTKGIPATSEVTTKPLPHVQSVISQAIEGFNGSVIGSTRTPTFYNIGEGATVTIGGQHQAVYVSSLTNDNEMYRSRPEGNSTTNTLITSHHEIDPLDFTSNVHDEQLAVPDIISGQIIWEDHDGKKGIKNEEDLEPKDLVRQALQEAVSHHSPRISTEELLCHEYGSNDCISDDGICQSSFSVQNKPQEVLMMTGHLGAIQNGTKLIGSVGTLLPSELANGTQVLVLQATAVSDVTNGSTVDIVNRRRRSNREVVQPRKKNVANRMKEKRANENEEQRQRRRYREAERMRKKRLQEDDSTKQRRRYEAAERARKRRANLSPSERDVERKKAAQRMRVRRLKENEEERKLRRDKAAERMRVRRSKETPEEKAIRRQGNVSVKIKGKRKKEKNFEDEYVKVEEISSRPDSPPQYLTDSSNSPSNFSKSKDDNSKSTNSHKISNHIILNTTLNNSSNFTLLTNDDIHNEGRFMQMPISDFTEAVEVRGLTQTETQRICMSSSPNQMAVNKRIVTNQAPPSYMESVSPDVVVTTESQNDSGLIHKQSGAQLGVHHLPHLLHHQHLSSYSVDHHYNSDQALIHPKNH